MKNERKVQLDKEKREDMMSAIRSYFLNERGEEIGQMASGFFLDFIIDKLAPEFYNQGVMDSQKYMSERVEDMQSLTK